MNTVPWDTGNKEGHKANIVKTFGNIGDKVLFENDLGIHKGYIKNNIINKYNNIIIRSEKTNYFIDIDEIEFIKGKIPKVTFGKIGDKALMDETMTCVITDNIVSKDDKVAVTMSSGGQYVIDINRIKIINFKKQNKKQNKKQDKEMNNKWEFRSVVKEDIDFDLIYKDLSKKNPLMLITIGKEKIVGVHDSLYIKAGSCDIQNPSCNFFHISFAEIEGEFSDWIAWAKDVKKAKWPAEMVNKRKVKVVLPTI